MTNNNSTQTANNNITRIPNNNSTRIPNNNSTQTANNNNSSAANAAASANLAFMQHFANRKQNPEHKEREGKWSTGSTIKCWWD